MSESAWMGYAEAQMLWLERHRHPVLDVLFGALTALGVETFLLLFVALGYWLIDRAVFARAATMLVVAAFLNTWIKGIFSAPRPDVSHVLPASGWSFPSGHAQVAAALWGGLAWEIRARAPRASGALVLLALGVAASRPYLGVHYPHDVAVGLALGALQIPALAAWVRSGRSLDGPTGLLAGTAVGVGALVLTLTVLDPSVADLGARLAGAGTGLALGVQLAGRSEPPTRAVDRLVLVAVGLPALLLPWLGLRHAAAAMGLEDALLAAFARYVLVGLSIGAAPRLAAGLRRRDPVREAA